MVRGGIDDAVLALGIELASSTIVEELLPSK
jgi:hypothetical protein